LADGIKRKEPVGKATDFAAGVSSNPKSSDFFLDKRGAIYLMSHPKESRFVLFVLQDTSL